MKKLLLIISLLLFCIAVKAQTKDTTTSNHTDTTKYYNVEVAPDFPGGMVSLYKFITKTGRSQDVNGKVSVTFVVEKDGSLSNIHVTKSLSESADKEALRIMSKCPKWIPGTQGGRPVRVQYTIPINF